MAVKKKENVALLSKARARVDKQKQEDERNRTLDLHRRIWDLVLAELGDDPDIALVSMQIAILYPPDKWWTSSWSTRCKKLFCMDRDGKKRYMSNSDMYTELATQCQHTAAGYRALARKRPLPKGTQKGHF